MESSKAAELAVLSTDNKPGCSNADARGQPTARKVRTTKVRRKTKLGILDCLDNVVGTFVGGVSCNPFGWLLCRPMKESLATSLTYLILMLLSVMCCMVLSSDWIVSKVLIKQVELADDDDDIVLGLNKYWWRWARRWVSYFGVYRICSVMATFHAVLALFTLGAGNSESLRGRIHHGYWMVKFTVLYLLLFASMYVPLEISYVRFSFTMACVVGGLLFTVIKFLALIEDFYITHQSYSKLKHESVWMRLRYYVVTVLITLVNWALIVLVCGVTLLCRRSECRLFEIVIYCTSALCFLLTLVSVLMHRRTKAVLRKQTIEHERLMKRADDTLKREEARKHIELARKTADTLALRKNRSGWFEGSLVSLYVLYLTLAAIDTVPAELCTKCMLNRTANVPFSFVNSNVTASALNSNLAFSSPKPKRIKIPNLGSVREYEDGGQLYVSCTFYRALIGLFRQPLQSLVNLEVELGFESPFNLNEAMHLAVRFYAYIGLLVMVALTGAVCVKLSRQTSDYGDTLPHPAARHQLANKACSTSKSLDAVNDDVQLTAVTTAGRTASATNLAASVSQEPEIRMRKPKKKQKVYVQVGSVLRDEIQKTRYNYAAFHLIVMGAYLYVMASLTNWYNPKTHATIERSDTYMESYVIRMVSAITVFCAYLFRLLFPRTSILPHTVFKRYRLSFIHAKVERKRNETSKSSETATAHF